MARQQNAATVAERWSRGLSNSVDKMREGVLAVTTAPSEAAIAAKDRYLTGVQTAVADGRYERGLRRVTLQQWQESFINKGVARISSGAAAAKPAVTRFMEGWLPLMQQASQRVATMPKGTLQDAQQRANFMIAFAHAQKGKISGK
jgi:hypothetical protein